MKKQIIIGTIMLFNLGGGFLADSQLSQIPPNFIYAQHNNYYYYQGNFGYCEKGTIDCYEKDDLVCIKQDKERCSPKICLEKFRPIHSDDSNLTEKYIQDSDNFVNNCTKAKLKTIDNLYFYDSKLRTSRKLTPSDTPEIITSDWYQGFQNNEIFSDNNNQNVFSTQNHKYRANLPQYSEFISFIK